MAEHIEIARTYLRNGWSPIPVEFKRKNPKNSGWQNLRVTEETFNKYFRSEPSNIGVLLGEPSGGLIDIDLDCDEAVVLAGHFLPRTATFGRDSNRRSHWIFECESTPSTAKFAEDGKTILLELRSTGHQTVFPGSVYSSGEPIRWDSPECTLPTRIVTADLEKFLEDVQALAAATILMRCWQSGARDDLATAIAGSLVRDGWEPEKIDWFVGLVAEAANDNEAKSRLKALRLSAIHAGKHSGHVPGWKKVAEIVGEARAEKLRKWLTRSHTPGAKENSIPDYVAELNEKHAVVLVGGKVVILTELPPDPDGGRRDIALSHPNDLRNLYANRPVSIGNRIVNAAQAWMESLDRVNILASYSRQVATFQGITTFGAGSRSPPVPATSPFTSIILGITSRTVWRRYISTSWLGWLMRCKILRKGLERQ